MFHLCITRFQIEMITINHYIKVMEYKSDSYLYALSEITKTEQFLSDDKYISDYCRNSKKEDNAYSHIKYKMSIKDNIFYAKRMIVDSIYREVNLEGLSINYSQVQMIYDGHLIPAYSFEDITRIVNLKWAWYYIFDTLDYPFDIRYIKHLNSIIRRGITPLPLNKEKYNTDKLATGTIRTIEYLDKELVRVRDIENPIQRSLELFLSVLKLQVFKAGNNSTAQLIANHEMISNGAGIISIPVEKKTEFGNLLVDYYESNKKKIIMDFLNAECVSYFTRTKEIDFDLIEKQKKEDKTAINQFMKKYSSR